MREMRRFWGSKEEGMNSRIFCMSSTGSLSICREEESSGWWVWCWAGMKAETKYRIVVNGERRCYEGK